MAEVEALTGPRGFSAATAEALIQWVALAKTRQMVEEYEQGAGTITDHELAGLEAEWRGL